MSKMSNHIVREAEAASLDNAAEVQRLLGIIDRAAEKIHGVVESTHSRGSTDAIVFLHRQGKVDLSDSVMEFRTTIFAVRNILADAERERATVILGSSR